MKLEKNIKKNVKVWTTSESDLMRIGEPLGDKYAGSFARNELNYYHMPSFVYETDKDVGMIINYEERRSGGTHWVALAREDKKWYFFAPFGIEPLKEIEIFLAELGVSTFIRNTVQIQEASSNMCGYHCMEFLKALLLNDESFASIINNLSWDELHLNTQYIKNKYS